jgi:hypothetical protein
MLNVLEIDKFQEFQEQHHFHHQEIQGCIHHPRVLLPTHQLKINPRMQGPLLLLDLKVCVQVDLNTVSKD